LQENRHKTPILPARVYINACPAKAPSDIDIFDAAEIFKSQIKRSLGIEVYGVNGPASGLISLPGDSSWKPTSS
jgi:hypothetical protein